MRLFALLVVLLAAAPSAAQEPRTFQWSLDGRPAPLDRSQASENGFGAMMLVTPDAEGFWRAWEGPSPPQLAITETATRGRPVHAMLIFSGCRAGPDGNCNVSARLGITAPNGSRYGEILEAPVWRGPPAPGYNLQLSEASLGFILEPEDSLGVYILSADVTDHVAGTTLHVEQAVTAEEEG